MEAKELRIGNIVKRSDLSPEFVIETPSDLLMADYFSPIILNEEWMGRFGFTIECSELILRIGTGAYLLFKGGKIYLNWGQFSEDTLVEPCEYVHQLQNLIFSLSGQEPTIK